MELSAQVSGIAALAEPVRRDLYHHVVTQPEPVSRDAAAEAVGVPAHTARFHLDRLVDEGLLTVEFRRLSGRTGPGAGRPTKLYRRSSREFSVSVPARRYDLVGHLLATAVEESSAGTPLQTTLDDVAYREGRRVGAHAAAGASVGELQRLAATLSDHGYEPHVDGAGVTLANCPFDTLAKEHTALVCGLNHGFVQGVADGLGCDHVEARLEPAAGQCCVTARPTR